MSINSNILIFNRNHADSATITASSENANFPAENVKTEPRRQSWRTTSITSQYLTLDMGSDIPLMNAICLIGHNSTAAGTWSLYAHDSNTIFPGTPGSATLKLENQNFYPSTFGYGEFFYSFGGYGGVPEDSQIAMMNKTIFKTFDQKQLRYWHLTFNDATNGDGHIEIGRLFLGLAFQPEKNFSWGNGLNLIDRSIQTRTPGGGMITDIHIPFRKKTFTLSNLTDSEKYFEIFELTNTIGRRGNLVISFHPLEEDTGRLFETIYGKIVRYSEVRQNNVDTNAITFDFEELP